MVTNRYSGPTQAQKAQYLSVTGHPWQEGTTKGSFSTERPFNKPWEYSPWGVRYVFHRDTGHLYCELYHRMTNNRCYGWSIFGLELSEEEIAKVYPSDSY